MDRPLLFILLSFLLMSCFDKSNSLTIEKNNDSTAKSHREKYTDSFVIPIGDSFYKLTINIFDSANDSNAERNNAVLTFRSLNGNHREILFKDSIFCMYPDIDFQDFNNDKNKDVLVFNYSGARANPTYYLYLTNLKKRNLVKVNGFENLPNPDLDTTHNIITSIALAGRNYYSFYEINSEDELVNLGHRYEDNPNDTTLYQRTISKILMERK